MYLSVSYLVRQFPPKVSYYLMSSLCLPAHIVVSWLRVQSWFWSYSGCDVCMEHRETSYVILAVGQKCAVGPFSNPSHCPLWVTHVQAQYLSNELGPMVQHLSVSEDKRVYAWFEMCNSWAAKTKFTEKNTKEMTSMSTVNILHEQTNWMWSIVRKQLFVLFVLLPIETGSLKTDWKGFRKEEECDSQQTRWHSPTLSCRRPKRTSKVSKEVKSNRKWSDRSPKSNCIS